MKALKSLTNSAGSTTVYTRECAKTPSTNAAEINSDFAAVPYGFQEFTRTLKMARTLETELTALTAERADVIYQRMCKVEHELRSEVERLTSDRARLDWLESDAGVDWQWHVYPPAVSRANIDAAMKEDAK